MSWLGLIPILLAHKSGYFDAELVAMEVKGKKTAKLFTTDEHPRESTLEMLAQLPLVFKEGRVVTAGNASVRRGCGTPVCVGPDVFHSLQMVLFCRVSVMVPLLWYWHLSRL